MSDFMTWAWPIQMARMIASIPSIFGASYIIQHVLWSEKRRKRVFTRILLVMSVMDLVFALTSVFSSSITPQQVKFPYPTLSIGTWTTCQVFGFLGHGASLSSVLYNASLSLYYVLTIRDGWTDWRIHQSKVEPLLHAIPLLIGWSIAIAALPLDLYNPTVVGCGIISYPPACESPLRPNVVCERGKHGDIYRLAFLDVWVWIVFAFLVTSMILIYAKLAKIDRATPKVLQSQTASFQVPSSAQSPHSPGAAASGSTATLNNNSSSQYLKGLSKTFRLKGQEQQQEQQHSPSSPTTSSSSSSIAVQQRPRSLANLNRLKHQFAVQALLYAFAFFLTFFFDTLALILRAMHMSRPLLPCIFLANIFLPLQGFWNAFIYIRPRYLRYRKKQQQEQERQQAQQERQIAQQEKQQAQQEQWNNLQQQKRTEAASARLAQAARLAAQRGVAFLHALSAKAEDDEDDEEAEVEEDEKLEEDAYISRCVGSSGVDSGDDGALASENHDIHENHDTHDAKVLRVAPPEENPNPY